MLLGRSSDEACNAIRGVANRTATVFAAIQQSIGASDCICTRSVERLRGHFSSGGTPNRLMHDYANRRILARLMTRVVTVAKSTSSNRFGAVNGGPVELALD